MNFSLKPLWLQRANRAPVLLAALCICAICQGSIVNGFISTSISSLEKRFSLSSTQSGIFSSFYDVAVVLVLIPLSHFGNKCHKGRVIATGMVLVGIGSILLILPHFFAGKYSVGEQRQTVCNSSPSEDVCLEGVTGVSAIWFYILLASQLLIGVGAAPLFTLGISYMDENVSQNSVALYLGMSQNLSISGTSDPRWYGAWWIGFAIAGAFSLLSSIPLFGFPKELPEKQRHRLKDVKQTHKDLDKDFGKSLADYPKIVLVSIDLLKRNKAMLCFILLDSRLMSRNLHSVPATDILSSTDFQTLIRNPSVMALMAMQTSEAFLMNGIIVVPMGLFGSLFGAILAKKTLRFQPTIALAIIFNVCALCFSFVFLHECEQKPFAGVTHDYTGLVFESVFFL
ncbi:unnamed protein product [Toxocara canis]|uniref:Solute carrier organic anion transporter family member n=1 Tax=Toxocara canis TaxID=6265 RepID=A0A183TX58_TOXCA|nr:unnamed protein product [Toxocara canis]